MTTSNRFEVTQLLKRELRGKELSEIAHSHCVTIRRGDKINKGWVGQTLDKVAKTTAISAQAKDGSDFGREACTRKGSLYQVNVSFFL